jgi:hypothetical protein
VITRCPVCSASMREAFRATVLRKHEACYDFCQNCGFLRIREPNWFDEAYETAICAADTGLVRRNLLLCDRLAVLCPLLGGEQRFLDYGGGVGLLVRLMRDRGIDFWWSDRHAQNVLACGFEYRPSLGGCTAVTAIEVLEHVPDPIEFIAEAVAAGDTETLIFTTELFEGGPPPQEWWYYARAEGQHIAFFRRDTLEMIGRRLSMRLLSDGWLHMLTRSPLDESRLVASGARWRRLAAKLRDRRRSLIVTDHDGIVARLSEHESR